MNDETDLEIVALQAKIDRLKKEKAEFDALPLDQRVAEVLHSKFCRWNHEDQCGWYYRNHQDKLDTEWHKKARELIKATNVLAQYDIDQFQFILGIIKCL